MEEKKGNESLSDDKLSELRKRAEEVARHEPINLDGAEQLIHELQVHQIELEMQNKELRKTQLEVESARDKFSDLYDFAPVGYYTESEQGLILTANLTLAIMLGVARGNLIKKPISDFIFNSDQDIYYLHRKKLFDTQDPQACELRIVKSDKNHFWAHLAGKLVVDRDSGEQVYFAVVSNITGRILAEKALETLNAELEERVGDRTEQLQTMVSGMAGREVRMAELKKVVTELRKQLKDHDLTPIAFDPLLGPEDEW
jgi:PAS domain S-box-containing protein